MALRASAEQPPAIAEFAPQAQEIKAAPAEQAGNLGQPASVGSIRSAPSPAPSPPAEAQYLHCVGDPPRQIEDPQSPPCVPYWVGNNGGSTSTGVSASSVTVYWVYQNTCPPDSASQATADALQRFFNTRFELYDRQIDLKVECDANTDTPSMQASADDVVGNHGFASTEYEAAGGYAYTAELARHGVIGITGFEANPNEAQMRSYQPYMWSYEMSSDRMLTSLGRWYCAVLNGHAATHAGPLLSGKARKLAIVYDPGDKGWQTDLTPLKQELAACGVSPMEIDDANNTLGSNAVVQMQSSGITTAMCVCWYINWATSYTYPAAEQNYVPEWILFSYGGGDTQALSDGGNVAPQELAATFGLTFQPRQVQLLDDPMWWAVSEAAPGIAQPTNWGLYYQLHLVYRSLLEIVSGIQMAGPRLTAGTFSAGLQHAVFPNPDTSIKAGAVGFLGGTHSMTIDAAEWWWSNTAKSPWAAQGDTATGAICYVEHGRRFNASDWRAGMPDELMQPPCDSGG